MKLITPQKARELSLSGHKIKCQLTREAETDFINFLNKHRIPHGDLSTSFRLIEHGKSSVRLFEVDPKIEWYIPSRNSETVSYSISDDMFLFFDVDL